MSQNCARILAPCLLVLGLGAAPASAATVTAYDLLDSFNVITSGNLTTSSETEGAVLVGGNLGPGSGGLDNKTGSAPLASNLSAAFARVSVYGSASGNWTVTAGDAVMIGGSSAASFANAGTVTSNAIFSISASTVQQALANLSTTLGTQTATPVTPDTSHALTFNGAQNGGTDYFTISLSDLATATSVGFNLGSAANADTAVINVIGKGDLTQAFNFVGGIDPSHILWNFEAATSLELTGFEGTVLALDAAVTNTSAINGTLAAASYNGNGEVHSHAFTGNQITPPTSTPPPTDVPEPASFGIFVSALLGLAATRGAGRRGGRGDASPKAAPQPA